MTDKKKRKRLYVTRRDTLKGIRNSNVDGNEIQDKGINLHFDDFLTKKQKKKDDDRFDDGTGFIDELH